MITREQAQTGNYFHIEGQCNVTIGARGRVKVDFMLYRKNGRLTEKKRSGVWRLPLKRGMYEFYEINESNLNEFHLESECEALQEAQHLRALPITELVHMSRIGYAGVTN